MSKINKIIFYVVFSDNIFYLNEVKKGNLYYDKTIVFCNLHIFV
jgi:hypothetical protein